MLSTLQLTEFLSVEQDKNTFLCVPLISNVLRITSCYFLLCAVTFLILSLHVCARVLDLSMLVLFPVATFTKDLMI